MGYDLHVVRASHWTDAAQNPIAREDLANLIEVDAELAWSASDYIDMLDGNGETIRFPFISWRGESCFLWYRDQITCKNPNEAQIAKLIHIAMALNAQVIGDDGETYVLRRGFLGREKIYTIRA